MEANRKNEGIVIQLRIAELNGVADLCVHLKPTVTRAERDGRLYKEVEGIFKVVDVLIYQTLVAVAGCINAAKLNAGEAG